MITNRIYEWARTQPAKTAMIHGDRLYSYAVFARAIEATRIFLRNLKLPAGRTAVVCIGNLADAWIVLLGLRSIGLNTISVSSIKAAKSLGVRDIACVVVTEAEKQRHGIDEQSWSGITLVAVPSTIYKNIQAGDIPRHPDDAPSLGGHITYTSGTTGYYKKIFTDGGAQSKRDAYRAHGEPYDERTVHFLANFAPWTGVGFNLPSAVWHAGGCVVFNQSPDSFLRSFRHGVTRTFMAPPMVDALLRQRGDATEPLGEFELFVGGGFVPLALAQRAVEKLTKLVTIDYGATEHTSGMRGRFRTRDDLHWLVPDVSTFEIVGHHGGECLADEEGELRVRLRDIDATSYLDDEETSRKFFRDGYFYPGDMAVRRADGRIRILGRVADVLNVQGQKIAAAPTEHKIQESLGVSAVCLFSLLNDDAKEELVVAIEATRVPPKSELDKVAREFKSFERVRFEVLQEFPRTEAGMQKINRKELRKIIVGKGARADGGLN
jgi:acyl-coenzyme A synthetase/AMP-(fatty) acid ligase